MTKSDACLLLLAVVGGSIVGVGLGNLLLLLWLFLSDYLRFTLPEISFIDYWFRFRFWLMRKGWTR